MFFLCQIIFSNHFKGPISVQGRDFINKMTFQIWLPRYEDIRNSEADERIKQAILDNAPKIRSMEGTNRLQKLKLTIPKFSIDFDEDVKELMSKNGLDQMFRQGFIFIAICEFFSNCNYFSVYGASFASI